MIKEDWNRVNEENLTSLTPLNSYYYMILYLFKTISSVNIPAENDEKLDILYELFNIEKSHKLILLICVLIISNRGGMKLPKQILDELGITDPFIFTESKQLLASEINMHANMRDLISTIFNYLLELDIITKKSGNEAEEIGSLLQGFFSN